MDGREKKVNVNLSVNDGKPSRDIKENCPTRKDVYEVKSPEPLQSITDLVHLLGFKTGSG